MTDRDGFAFLEGRIVPLSEARVPLLDRGYLLGDGAFETMRSVRSRILFRELHLDRLRRAARSLGLPVAAAGGAMRAADLLASRAAVLGDDSYVRVQIVVGPSATFGGDAKRPLITGFARRLRPWPHAYYERGLRVRLAARWKLRADPMAPFKTLSALAHTLARRDATRAGADDALLLNDAGRVAEATTSNVFAVIGGALRAPGPSEGAVDGITRLLVLEAAREKGIQMEEPLPLAEIPKASEMFLTNSVAGVAPVAQVADVADFLGPRGPVTRSLAAAYMRRVEVEAGPSRAETARVGVPRGPA